MHNIRKPLKFKNRVPIPEKWRKYLWDEPSGEAPVEKVVLRVLMYGGYEDWREVYERYPEVCKYVAENYPQIHRGVKFWIKWWEDGN
ncbi:MAG: hypothetical protein GXO48_02915 [Chlorobi bacterium]|nr:hypothetical protein [Chlorobiota bacterium]